MPCPQRERSVSPGPLLGKAGAVRRKSIRLAYRRSIRRVSSAANKAKDLVNRYREGSIAHKKPSATASTVAEEDVEHEPLNGGETYNCSENRMEGEAKYPESNLRGSGAIMIETDDNYMLTQYNKALDRLAQKDKEEIDSNDPSEHEEGILEDFDPHILGDKYRERSFRKISGLAVDPPSDFETDSDDYKPFVENTAPVLCQANLSRRQPQFCYADVPEPRTVEYCGEEQESIISRIGDAKGPESIDGLEEDYFVPQSYYRTYDHIDDKDLSSSSSRIDKGKGKAVDSDDENYQEEVQRFNLPTDSYYAELEESFAKAAIDQEENIFPHAQELEQIAHSQAFSQEENLPCASSLSHRAPHKHLHWTNSSSYQNTASIIDSAYAQSNVALDSESIAENLDSGIAISAEGAIRARRVSRLAATYSGKAHQESLTAILKLQNDYANVLSNPMPESERNAINAKLDEQIRKLFSLSASRGSAYSPEKPDYYIEKGLNLTHAGKRCAFSHPLPYMVLNESEREIIRDAYLAITTYSLPPNFEGNFYFRIEIVFDESVFNPNIKRVHYMIRSAAFLVSKEDFERDPGNLIEADTILMRIGRQCSAPGMTGLDPTNNYFLDTDKIDICPPGTTPDDLFYAKRQKMDIVTALKQKYPGWTMNLPWYNSEVKTARPVRPSLKTQVSVSKQTYLNKSGGFIERPSHNSMEAFQKWDGFSKPKPQLPRPSIDTHQTVRGQSASTVGSSCSKLLGSPEDRANPALLSANTSPINNFPKLKSHIIGMSGNGRLQKQQHKEKGFNAIKESKEANHKRTASEKSGKSGFRKALDLLRPRNKSEPSRPKMEKVPEDRPIPIGKVTVNGKNEIFQGMPLLQGNADLNPWDLTPLEIAKNRISRERETIKNNLNEYTGSTAAEHLSLQGLTTDASVDCKENGVAVTKFPPPITPAMLLRVSQERARFAAKQAAAIIYDNSIGSSSKAANRTDRTHAHRQLSSTETLMLMSVVEASHAAESDYKQDEEHYYYDEKRERA